MPFVEEANNIYLKRLKHYVPTSIEIIPEQKLWKKMSVYDRTKEESKAILNKLQPNDSVLLLDEKGKEYTSIGFSKHIQKLMNQGVSRIVLVVGGAYGFSNELYENSFQKLSLSKMTFSHQMVRCFALEQVYRAMTILSGEPYHNS